MYSQMEKMNGVIDYIETHLTEDMPYERFAGQLCLSLYEFRRVFSFIIGVPIGEYVRRRRLSEAAIDLQVKGLSVSEVATKYGYPIASSFARSFREEHGVTPTQARQTGVTLRTFARASLSVCVSGVTTLEYSLEQDEAFCVCGKGGVSDFTDTDCCEDVWKAFEKSGAHERLSAQGVYGGKQYAVYENGREGVKCTIGARGVLDGFDCTQVPSSLWAVFQVKDGEDAEKKYAEINGQWLSSVSLRRRADVPTVEVFALDGTSWEIRIPVTKEGACVK